MQLVSRSKNATPKEYAFFVLPSLFFSGLTGRNESTSNFSTELSFWLLKEDLFELPIDISWTLVRNRSSLKEEHAAPITPLVTLRFNREGLGSE